MSAGDPAGGGLRVLIVNNFARVTGGADLHCLELTKGLRERGHEVRWLATRSEENLETSGEFVPFAVEAGTREHLGPRQRLRAARWALWNPHAAAAADRLMREYRPDVVHVHKAYVQLSVAPVVVASKHSVPVVQTAHDFEFVSASMVDPEGGIWDRDESRLSYRALNSATMLARRYVHRPRVAGWIAVSADLARAYRENAGIEATVIPNFTEPSLVEPATFEERSGVVFIGRLAEEKGLEHVIEAARLAPELPFTVAGGGPMAGRVRAAADGLPNLEYAGQLEHSQGRALLAGARICAMPSLWREPGSLVGLEAMSEGTPVATYRRGGLAEYVRKAGAGVFSDPEDARGLAQTLRGLYADRTNWERLSANGRTAAGTVHSLPAYLDVLEQIYGSLAADARPVPQAAG